MIRVIDEIDPAEAATSPGHGSNNPAKEKAVNRQQATIAPASSARVPFDYEAAFCELEDFIVKAKERLRTLVVLADAIDEVPCNGGVTVKLGARQLEALRFMIGEAADAVQEIDDAWVGPMPPPVLVRFDDLDEGVQLGTLIGEHRNAASELEASIVDGQKDGRMDYEETERFRHAEADEKRAFERLVMWRPKTNAGGADRLHYLFGDSASPWAHSAPDVTRFNLLLSSMSDAWKNGMAVDSEAKKV